MICSIIGSSKKPAKKGDCMKTYTRWDGLKFRVGEVIEYGKTKSRIEKFNDWFTNIVIMRDVDTNRRRVGFVDQLKKINGAIYWVAL